MIYTERKVSIKNNKATIDSPIILFRGDREVDIMFTIVDSKFKFESNKGNVIDKTQAAFGQLAVALPDGTDLFTEIVECENGVVVFSITGEMIDEIHEVGFYSFHIRLYNDDKTSRITLPPVMEGIEIIEPLIIEGDVENTDLVGDATVGYSMVQTVGVDEEVFDEDGNYIPTVWGIGDKITAEKLNKIEEGISKQEVNSSIDAYTKEEVDSIIQDYTGGKKQVYLTQAEYDALNDDDKNDETKVYNIIDVEDTVADSLILTSPNGSKFVIIVSDDGTLSAAPYENVEPEDPVEPTLTSISVIYTQGETIIYPDSSLDDLRTSLVVTANYSDGTSNNVADYTLSGELTVGTSAITVSFEDKTTIFNVEVSSNSQTPVDPEEPASYTNYIYNEDTFTNPAAGTTPSATTYYYINAEATGHEVVEPGVLKIYNISEGNNASIFIRHGMGDNNIYYIQFKIRSEAAIIAGSPQQTILNSNAPVEDWTMISFIYTDTAAVLYSIKLTVNNKGAIPGVAYIKEPMRINLTEIYGTGNEPSDVKECDTIFATFVPGLRG